MTAKMYVLSNEMNHLCVIYVKQVEIEKKLNVIPLNLSVLRQSSCGQ